MSSPKIPALGYALLGMLMKPSSGYDLRKIFSSTSMKTYSGSPGAIYPALQRLEKQGLIAAKDGVSENRRRARYYNLTAKGRKRLTAESSKWARLTEAIARIMQPAEES